MERLTQSLGKMKDRLDEEVEIIFIDDASGPPFMEMNRAICESVGTYIPLNQNLGRARIRNHFLQFTQYEWLLFLDCDSLITDEDFLQKYLAEIKEGVQGVSCG